MKINPVFGNLYTDNVKKKNGAQAKEVSGIAENRDEVSISDEALSFSKIFTQAKSTDEVTSPDRAAKLAELTEKVKNGQYDVDNEKLAEKIIATIVPKE